jgi:LppP/LprE lipoprotein
MRAVLGAASILLVAATAAAAPRTSDLKAAQAFVARHCYPGSLRSAELWQVGWTFNALYGDCGGGDGHDQRVWFFAGRRFIGNDAPKSSAEIIGLWRDGTTIAVLYVRYRRADALCCPTGGGAVVRFRWNGHRVVRLDPLPAARYP